MLAHHLSETQTGLDGHFQVTHGVSEVVQRGSVSGCEKSMLRLLFLILTVVVDEDACGDVDSSQWRAQIVHHVDHDATEGLVRLVAGV